MAPPSYEVLVEQRGQLALEVILLLGVGAVLPLDPPLRGGAEGRSLGPRDIHGVAQRVEDDGLEVLPSQRRVEPGKDGPVEVPSSRRARGLT